MFILKKVFSKISTLTIVSGIIVAPVICLTSCSSTINTKDYKGFPDKLTFTGKNSSGGIDLSKISVIPKDTQIEYTVQWPERYHSLETLLTPPIDLWNGDQLTLKLIGVNGKKVSDSHTKTYTISDLPPSNAIYNAQQINDKIPLTDDDLKTLFIYKTISLPDNKVLSFYSNGPGNSKGGLLQGSYVLDPSQTEINYKVDTKNGNKIVTPKPDLNNAPNIDLSEFSQSEYLLKNDDGTGKIVPWELQFDTNGSISKFEPLDFSNTQWISNTFPDSHSTESTPLVNALVKTATGLYNIARDPQSGAYTAIPITIPPIDGNEVQLNHKPIASLNKGDLIFSIKVGTQSKIATAHIEGNNMTWVGSPIPQNRDLWTIEKLSNNAYIGVSEDYQNGTDPNSDTFVDLSLINIDPSNGYLKNQIVAPKHYKVLSKKMKNVIPGMTLVPTDFQRVNDNFGIFSSPEGIYAITLKADGTGIAQDSGDKEINPYNINPTLYSLDITSLGSNIDLYLLSGLSPIFDQSGKFVQTRQSIQVVETC